MVVKGGEKLKFVLLLLFHQALKRKEKKCEKNQ